MGGRQVCLALAAALLSGCASGVQYVAETKPEDLSGNAVLVGSLLSPDDGITDVLYVVNLDTREGYRVMNKDMIPEDSEHYEVGMFALVVPAGRYAYASVNYSSGIEKGGSAMTWAGPRPLLDREVAPGDFIYVGRAYCEATRIGCKWSVTDESERDLPFMKRLSPRLPWQNVRIR